MRSYYKSVFESDPGQHVLHDLCKKHDLFSASPFTAGDPQSTAYFLGKQDCIKEILRFVYKNFVEAATANHQYNNQHEEAPKI